MPKQNINDYLQVKKSTGEILTMRQPIYIGQELFEVYSYPSENKHIAFEKCRQLLHDLTCDNNGMVLNRGIVSKNGYNFVFCAVIEIDELKFVVRCSSDRRNCHYDLGSNTTDMIVKIYLLEE